MTWYANEVLAPGSPAVVRAISRDPLLAPFAYHLNPPLEYPWYKQEMAHGLPASGLVVVRPICGGRPDQHPAAWYREPVRDWLLFSTPADADVSALRGRIAESCSIPLESLPPAAMLSHLKGLARETESPFIFYDCAMWGGDVDSEFAFVFSHSDRAFVGLQSPAPVGRRPLAVYEGDTPRRVLEGDVLVFALKHLGLELPTPFFAPHTRSFPWSRYKLHREPGYEPGDGSESI